MIINWFQKERFLIFLLLIFSSFCAQGQTNSEQIYLGNEFKFDAGSNDFFELEKVGENRIVVFRKIRNKPEFKAYVVLIDDDNNFILDADVEENSLSGFWSGSIIPLTDSTFAVGRTFFKINNDNLIEKQAELPISCNGCGTNIIGPYSSDTVLVNHDGNLALGTALDGKIHSLTNFSSPAFSVYLPIQLGNRKVVSCTGFGSSSIGCFVTEVSEGNAYYGDEFKICEEGEDCYVMSQNVYSIDSNRFAVVYYLDKQSFMKIGIVEGLTISYSSPIFISDFNNSGQPITNIDVAALSEESLVIIYNFGYTGPGYTRLIKLEENNTTSVSDRYLYNNVGPELGHHVIPLSSTKFMIQYYGGNPVYNFSDGRSYFHDGFFRLGSIDSQENVDSIVLGLEDEKEGRLFNVYPNPSDGQFCISQPITKNYKLQINNLSGQTILSLDLNSEKECVDLGSFPTGVYIINLSNSHSSVTGKIIIK
ncbi:putative secreted protein (Por secretion system target) [Roseivirga ehrenbergii]|uniref:Secretion system C-terminal sorting domain-containing protein n=1 Tax=Roseivirga ehrenbergii (strain DSM 102268 / JCM 13514 / KCTC 12282 / NCIMB 14502 / KMM 6017) TaxID=279360 RepID=A0A150XBY9_ROSEK|nr:T9SS type A sorting domain-containing protein [Roseivirga ehrenbergii]KYG76233.1 hypothetical protein MB14_03015 [Roseivirga ehrenbergii]TCL00239.1 putative secreted protein (Por secretion system target) [Roseivirga ehrenbergii]